MRVAETAGQSSGKTAVSPGTVRFWDIVCFRLMFVDSSLCQER